MLVKINSEIEKYNSALLKGDKEICDLLMSEINKNLSNSESKIWHGHPVWFLNGNPIVGHSKQKAGIRLMFWSGADFNEADLKQGTGKFKDASIIYTNLGQIKTELINYLLRFFQFPQVVVRV